MREKILAALLLGALLLVVLGVALWSGSVGLVIAGLGLAGWAWLFFGEVPDPETSE
jgi:hypothetical protein